MFGTFSSRRTFDGDEGRAEAESALEEMEEAEAEEREAEEVEDLLEYYMQRAASTSRKPSACWRVPVTLRSQLASRCLRGVSRCA